MVPKCFYCGQITTCIHCMIGLQLIHTPWPQQRFKKQTKKKKRRKGKKSNYIEDNIKVYQSVLQPILTKCPGFCLSRGFTLSTSDEQKNIC